MSRYRNTSTFYNRLELYKKAREKRDIPDALVQFQLTHLPPPTVEDIENLHRLPHIWTTGDRLYKLAQQHYGDPTLWWIIAWYNGRPTEGHFKVGDVIQIPGPLDQLYGILRI